MKKILFVINTLGHAGAEVALLELLKVLDTDEYDLSLFVLTGQGELISHVPQRVHLLNKSYSDKSVLSKEGKLQLIKTVFVSCFRNAALLRRLPYLICNSAEMIKKKRLLPDKLLWRILSDGAPAIKDTYDLAIAYLEGGSTYYVADHVNARKKAAFLHVDYHLAGYNRQLDLDAYQRFDRIFTVSNEVTDSFLQIYPEHAEKTSVFHNFLDVQGIREKSKEPTGFQDDFDGIRILTVGRLTKQKAYEIAIDAMALLKREGYSVRWYALGDGPERESLERKIISLDLKNDFLLLGAVSNPYPYYIQADLYVHATRFEGKSIAIQEAQILGCPIIASDCSGNREQIISGTDGLLCSLDPASVKEAIVSLIQDEEKRKRFGKAASEKKILFEEDLEMLRGLL